MFKRHRFFKSAVMIFFLLLCFTACSAIGQEGSAEEEQCSKQASQSGEKKIIEEQPIELDIICVGDIMVHTPQLKAQKISGEDTYDFTNNYKYVKKYIESADFAICNVETTFAGKPYYGYPLFAAPHELAKAIKNAGFDMASTANNHMNDRGKPGIFGTQQVLSEEGIAYNGSRKSIDEPRYTISEVEGVKIATIAYTYETPSSDGISINGIPVDKDCEDLINSFSYYKLDSDLPEMKSTADSARNAGADIVIFFMHWGEEYHTIPSELQKEIADFLVTKAGADIVFGSHPHVPQKLEFINGVPVYYSLGNFISNQRIETLGDPMTEVGLMAQVKLEYKKNKKEVSIKEATALPLWVERYYDAGRLTYEVIPLDGELAENPTVKKTGNLSRANAALERVKPFIGE